MHIYISCLLYICCLHVNDLAVVISDRLVVLLCLCSNNPYYTYQPRSAIVMIPTIRICQRESISTFLEVKEHKFSSYVLRKVLYAKVGKLCSRNDPSPCETVKEKWICATFALSPQKNRSWGHGT